MCVVASVSDASAEQVEAVTLLIVDDQPLNLKLLEAALRADQPYTIFEACDGIAAQEVLLNHRIDLVITDLMMPELDGHGLLAWARTHCPEPAWIIHSAIDTFNAAVHSLQLGAVDFIPKPIPSVPGLQRAVRTAVAQRRLELDRERLRLELARKTARLEEHVAQLEELCRVLRTQAETIQHDLERAELIQRALLPAAAPEIPGFAVDSVYRPTRTIGGDAYDVVRLGEHHVALYVADAAGHGVAAAMLSVVLKHRLAMCDPHDGTPLPPARVLAELNRALVDECAAPGLFVTAAYGLLDLRTRRLTLAAAGHPPCALHHAAGDVDLLERTGPALGLDRDASFTEWSIELCPGDQLLLYTDGLCDSSVATEPLTPAVIARRLASSARQGQSLLHDLLAAARANRGDTLDDDVTLLMLSANDRRVTPPSTLDHGDRSQPTGTTPPPLRGPSASPEITVGTTADATWVAVAGRGTWVEAATFHGACRTALATNGSLVIALTECSYLDSTFLGTVHEIVVGAPDRVALVAVPAEIRALFEELSMMRVLAAIRVEQHGVAPPMEPAGATVDAVGESRRRILRAHELLVALSPHNREQFQGVVDALRGEVPPD
jgi:phosphoserine phosphatase RsbU/P